MPSRSRIAQILFSIMAGVTLLALPAPSWAGRRSCVTGDVFYAGSDLAQMTDVKADIDADPSCACSAYDASEPGKRHGDYIRCAKAYVEAAVLGSTLRRQCKGTLLKIYRRSVCGFPASKNKVPCLKEKGAKVTCAIKPVHKCVDKPGVFTQKACGGFENCLDATDDNSNFIFNADPTGGDNGICPCDASEPPVYDSTFDAIQEIIFDGYGCSNNGCHGAVLTQGGLNLVAGSSYDNLVGISAFLPGVSLNRVEPGNTTLSFLYEKLAAKTNGTTTSGFAMPQVGAALTLEHLEVIERWIVADADADLTVPGTAELLNTCLPSLKVAVPDPPGSGVGAQFRSTPWPLAAPDPSGQGGAGDGEDEICMATYYNLAATSPPLIPTSAQFDCPSLFPTFPNNPTGKCFRYHKQILSQDPISHHSIIHIYTGIYDTAVVPVPGAPGWGDWTYKFEPEENNSLDGMACDPLAVDSTTGTNPGCSGETMRTVACIFPYGPPDYGNANPPTAPAFSGSQVSVNEVEYADGVYSVLPMAGIIVWNSHAFTGANTTMAQYLNLYAADPSDQLYPAKGIFDSDFIFQQNVLPFGEQELCDSFTLPLNAHLFNLGSHTHRHGIDFRTWLPPNEPCAYPNCSVPAGTPDYQSFDYSDPFQLDLDPLTHHYTSANADERTLIYCSKYDNGITTPLKLQSTSPVPPQFFVPGGPCTDSALRCANPGATQGNLCFGVDSNCDNPPLSDGDCDACTVLGGVTTEDEMFILTGTYYVAP